MESTGKIMQMTLLLVSAGFCVLSTSLALLFLAPGTLLLPAELFLLPSPLLSRRNVLKKIFLSHWKLDLLVKWSRRKHLSLRDWFSRRKMGKLYACFKGHQYLPLFLKTLPSLKCLLPYPSKVQSYSLLCSYSSHHFFYFPLLWNYIP